MSNKILGSKGFKFILFIVIILACWALGRVFKFDIEAARAFFGQYSPVMSGLIFVALYVGVTTFVWFGPKDVFRISGAILFGANLSTIFVWIGELLNAFILFHLSRKLGQDYVMQKFKVSEEKLEQMKNDSGFLGVLSVRINPFFPFRLLDLGYGLSAISFKKYLIVAMIASLPRIFWLQYIIAGAGEAIIADPMSMIDYLMANQQLIMYSGIYFLVVIVLTIAAVIGKMIKKRRAK